MFGNSLRRAWVRAAPTIIKPRPVAARGTKTGAMSSAAGRIRPIAASTSSRPRPFTVLSEKSSAQPWPVAASLALGWVSFIVPPARKTTASRPATVQRNVRIGELHMRAPPGDRARPGRSVVTQDQVRQLGPGADPELGIDLRQVGLDGAPADVELV